MNHPPRYLLWGPRSWRALLLAFLRRRRRPLVRLWDADFNYVSTLADGGISESWPAYARRLGLALVGRRLEIGHREVLDCSMGSSVTIDL